MASLKYIFLFVAVRGDRGGAELVPVTSLRKSASIWRRGDRGWPGELFRLVLLPVTSASGVDERS